MTHGAGLAADVVGQLLAGYAGARRRVGMFAADDVGDGEELERFMHDVTGDEDVSVIHLVQPNLQGEELGRALSLDLSDTIVDMLQDVERTLRRRFPALREVDSWVVVDLGRDWTDSAWKVAHAILQVAEDNRIRAVLAVAGSTMGSVAGDAQDRAGMVADVAWSLAASDFGHATGLASEVPGVWLVATRSFTANGYLWSLTAACDGVRRALLELPLRPAREGTVGQAIETAAAWVEQQGIGSEDERARLTSGASGAALEKLRIDRTAVIDKVPKHWGPAIEAEYKRLARAPLRGFTQLLKGNAKSLLNGSPLETTRSGYCAAFDAALRLELAKPSGCIRAARFVNGVIEALEAARESVVKQHPKGAAELADQRARAALDRATSTLAGVRPWLVRMLLFAVLTAVVSSQAPELWQAIAWASLSALLLGLWLASKRRKAIDLREAYVQAAEARIHAVAMERVIAEQRKLIEDLQEYIGSYRSGDGQLVPMEQLAEEDIKAGSRAADVHRIWQVMTSLAEGYNRPEGIVADNSAVSSVGRFFRAAPGRGAAKPSGRAWSTAAQERSDSVYAQAVLRLQEVELDWNHDSVSALLAELVTVDTPEQRQFSLALLAPEFASRALPALVRSNAPRLESDLHAIERRCLVAPDGGAPQGFEVLAEAADDIADSDDSRRIAVAWLVSQAFSPATSRDLPPAAESVQGSEPVQTPTAFPLADGGGV